MTRTKGVDQKLLGRRMKAAMIEADLDCDQMALLMHKAVSSIRGYLRGDHAPDGLTLHAWAAKTGKPLDYFIGESFTPASLPRPRHEGVDELEEDRALMAEEEVTEEDLAMLRSAIVLGPNGCLEITTKHQALRWLDAIRASRRHSSVPPPR